MPIISFIWIHSIKWLFILCALNWNRLKQIEIELSSVIPYQFIQFDWLFLLFFVIINPSIIFDIFIITVSSAFVLRVDLRGRSKLERAIVYNHFWFSKSYRSGKYFTHYLLHLLFQESIILSENHNWAALPKYFFLLYLHGNIVLIGSICLKFICSLIFFSA